SAQVEELIQAPGSPNLYWALTALPSPPVSLRKPLQGEKMLAYTELPELREIESKHLSSGQLRTLTDLVIRMMAILHDGPTTSDATWQGRLELTLLVTKLYPEAKRALAAQARPPGELDALPALQVVLIHS